MTKVRSLARTHGATGMESTGGEFTSGDGLLPTTAPEIKANSRRTVQSMKRTQRCSIGFQLRLQSARPESLVPGSLPGCGVAHSTIESKRRAWLAIPQ